MSVRISSKEQEELVLKNQRLVYYFVNKLSVHPSDYEDIVSIGTLGLIKAAITFDDSKKIAFATYAGKCINNEIFMYFRKKPSWDSPISLDEPIGENCEGREITLGDVLPNEKKDFIEELEEKEDFIKLISIVLNDLKPKERLIMLYEMAGLNQNEIAEMLNVSQSIISRYEKKIKKKVKTAFSMREQCKEVFSMTIVEDSYKISFATKDIKQFDEIFAILLEKLTSVTTLPDFKVIRNEKLIRVEVPAHPDSFSFIAQIIREIDEYTMTFVAGKNKI